ncbi:hypothetical protein IIE_04809 [Bacillus cereus VD045]|nr:hypothetical protein IIE_04809 [Bacillus cereus VD045]
MAASKFFQQNIFLFYKYLDKEREHKLNYVLLPSYSYHTYLIEFNLATLLT